MATPGYVTAPMAASGGAAAINLIEIITRSGALLAVSDQHIIAPSAQLGIYNVEFMDWLVGAPVYRDSMTSQTDTASLQIQNVSGDTIYRDLAKFFRSNELTGATFIGRIWRPDSEFAIYMFVGTLQEPQINNQTLRLTVNGLKNWNNVKAPTCQIGVTCGLDFGSIECGSTSLTPCNNSYGTCSAIERFKAIVTQWNGAPIDYTQVAQPAQVVQINYRRKF